jgi:predicted esterase
MSAVAQYPEVLVREPLSGSHRQSLILLHGRGSSAAKFGPVLLETKIPGFGSLPEALPHAKFIFPTASRRRARIFKRMPIRQWFDYWSLQKPEDREELQADGLRETSEYIHGLLRKEVELVGADNVVLGGLSQGCAASLVALLLWDGEPLAGGVGMCGWLPYRKMMENAFLDEKGEENAEEGEGGDIFSRFDDDEGSADERSGGGKVEDGEALPLRKAVECMCDELQVSRVPVVSAQATEPKMWKTPLFIGHGILDEKVPVGLGHLATVLMKAMNVDAHWKEYSDLGHWYSDAMLGDFIVFLRTHTTWEIHREGGPFNS